MITTRLRKRILLAANAVLIAATAAACSLALAPIEAPEVRAAPDRRMPAALHADQKQLLAPEAYAVIYQTDLRRPLFDPPPAIVAATQKAPVQMPIHLVGTILDNEKGFSYAIFRRANGDVKMIGVGEWLDGVEVISVSESSATVRAAGEVKTMIVEREAPRP